MSPFYCAVVSFDVGKRCGAQDLDRGMPSPNQEGVGLYTLQVSLSREAGSERET